MTLSEIASRYESSSLPSTVQFGPFRFDRAELTLSRDGEEVRLGDLMLTALATPGHTPGALSWRWVSCDGGVCRTIVYADSLSPVSRDDYRFSDHPAYLAAYRAAIATPGHTPGAMSYRWISCEGGVCRTIVYADSLTPISRDDYRFSAHPDYLKAYRDSIAKIAASPCDIIVSPHPSSSKLRDRFARGERLLDAGGCEAFAAAVSRQLDERLAKEAAAAKPKR